MLVANYYLTWNYFYFITMFSFHQIPILFLAMITCSSGGSGTDIDTQVTYIHTEIDHGRS